MNQPDNNAAILNDLLAIQHERITAYQAFMKYPVNDESAYTLFRTMADNSRNLLFELRGHMNNSCIDPADRIVIKTEIGRSWPGMRYFSPESNIADIFACCEYNEWLTMMTYQHALETHENPSPELQSLLIKQFSRMQESFKIAHAQKERPVEPSARLEARAPFLFTRGIIVETA